MNCSDTHVAHVCSQCGGLITVYAHTGDYASSYGQSGTYCTLCATELTVAQVAHSVDYDGLCL